jgi:hypothetical protein
LALFICTGTFAAWRYSGPSPQTAGPHTESAQRALETLHSLLGEEQAIHAAGSRENELVRLRLLDALNNLGAETWLIPLSDPDGSRTNMVNVVARIAGLPRARPVILTTHYDSCPHGPGAGDAGQCVAAILEIIRALHAEPLQYEFWCVFSDAEERGLWGAKDLVQRTDLPWGTAIPLVINFDARGDRGAALLFETHVKNLRAMQWVAPVLADPRVSTSLMVNIYQRLPNGTDFTAYRSITCPGWNFAVIGGAQRYHTAEDSWANLSPRSIQHFATHGLRLVRALDQLPADQLTQIEDSEPAVFFDCLGLFLVVMPARWNAWHCCGLGLAWLLLCFSLQFYAKARLRWHAVGGLVLGILTTLALGGLMGWAIERGWQAADLLPRRFVNYYEGMCLVYVLGSSGLIMALGRWGVWRCSRAELWISLLSVFLLTAVLSSTFFPGGAYLSLWPATVLAVLGLLDGWRYWPENWEKALAVLACLLPAVLYSPTYVLLAQAMGPTAGVLLSVGVTWMLLPTLVAWAQ